MSDTIELGPRTSRNYLMDPKRMAFVLSRYKFVAKILDGCANVLEVGCGDAFGSPIVAQSVQQLTCCDYEETLINSNISRLSMIGNIDFQVMDAIQSLPDGVFDAIYSIDMIEHIQPADEEEFLLNTCGSLSEHGMVIIGTPNVEAREYASELSASLHINLKGHADLRNLVSRFFHTTLLFSMNDEVVHTGFYAMAHYIFGIGVSPRTL